MPSIAEEFQHELSALAGLRPQMLQHVFEWSSNPAGSRDEDGLGRLVQQVARDLEAVGLPCEVIPGGAEESIDSRGKLVTQNLGPLLRCLNKKPGKPSVLLSCHLDVVPSGEKPGAPWWQNEKVLRGTGVTDAKGGVAVLVAALQTLERSSVADNLGWEILLNSDEEIGSPGSLPELQAAAGRHNVGLVFEPALPDGRLVGARKGSGNFAAVVEGRAAHAGREPEKGRNAIAAMASLILEMERLQVTLPGVTVNPGQVEGGGPLNRVPDLAIARFNVRVSDAAAQAAAERAMSDLAARLESREGISCRWHGGFQSPPKPVYGTGQALLLQVVEAGTVLGMDLQQVSSGGVCDGNKLAAAGLPNVDTMGPVGGGIHTPEEYLLVDSLVERARLSSLLLLGWAADNGSIPGFIPKGSQ